MSDDEGSIASFSSSRVVGPGGQEVDDLNPSQAPPTSRESFRRSAGPVPDPHRANHNRKQHEPHARASIRKQTPQVFLASDRCADPYEPGDSDKTRALIERHLKAQITHKMRESKLKDMATRLDKFTDELEKSRAPKRRREQKEREAARKRADKDRERPDALNDLAHIVGVDLNGHRSANVNR